MGNNHHFISSHFSCHFSSLPLTSTWRKPLQTYEAQKRFQPKRFHRNLLCYRTGSITATLHLIFPPRLLTSIPPANPRPFNPLVTSPHLPPPPERKTPSMMTFPSPPVSPQPPSLPADAITLHNYSCYQMLLFFRRAQQLSKPCEIVLYKRRPLLSGDGWLPPPFGSR